MEKALENTLIANKFMEYSVSLKSFFKEEFKSENSTSKYHFHIFYTLKEKSFL